MTVLRTPADRTDQFWPENVSKSEFLIVLRHPKVKIPETFGTTLSQNSRSSDQDSRKFMQNHPQVPKSMCQIPWHFWSLLGLRLFCAGNSPKLLKTVKKCSFSANFSFWQGFRTERLFCDWNLKGLPKSLQNCSKSSLFDGSWPDFPNPCPFLDWICSDLQKVFKNPQKLSKKSLFDHFLTLTLEKPLIGDLLGTLLALKTGFRVQNGILGGTPWVPPPPWPLPSDHGSDFRSGPPSHEIFQTRATFSIGFQQTLQNVTFWSFPDSDP